MTSLPPKLKRNDPANLILTDRDRDIIQAVFRFRFLTTEHIQTITKTEGRRAINRRLRELFDADYLARPELQNTLFARSDKRPTVHALGDAGAKLVEELNRIQLPKTVKWADKNRNLKNPEFITHSLGIADFFISLEQSFVHAPDGLSYLSEKSIINTSPAPGKNRIYPLSFPTRFNWWKDNKEVEISTVPDGMFALTDDRRGTLAKALFFLEYDGSTMPVMRSSHKQSSIIRKMLGYADIRDRKIHTKRFGYGNYRVLFVTRNRDQRIQTMCDAWDIHARSEIPAGSFLFADYDELIALSPFGDVWVNAKGEPISLVPDFSL